MGPHACVGGKMELLPKNPSLQLQPGARGCSQLAGPIRRLRAAPAYRDRRRAVTASATPSYILPRRSGAHRDPCVPAPGSPTAMVTSAPLVARRCHPGGRAGGDGGTRRAIRKRRLGKAPLCARACGAGRARYDRARDWHLRHGACAWVQQLRHIPAALSDVFLALCPGSRRLAPLLAASCSETPHGEAHPCPPWALTMQHTVSRSTISWRSAPPRPA